MVLTKKSENEVFPEEIELDRLISNTQINIARRYLEESRRKKKAIKIRSGEDYRILRNYAYKEAVIMGGNCKILSLRKDGVIAKYVVFIEKDLKSVDDRGERNVEHSK